MGRNTEAALLTGGQDRHYAVALAVALANENVRLDVIGSDEVDCPELHGNPNLTFVNLRGDTSRDAGLPRKIRRVLRYYLSLLRYAFVARPRLFHILWNNRFEGFDRTVLMFCYRLFGRRVLLTAHNINVEKRDSRETLLSQFCLRVQYRLCDRIFVHSEKMKRELCESFAVVESRVCVIPYGINNMVPNTALSSSEARRAFGLSPRSKVLLFFGSIAPYKGLECLVAAMELLTSEDRDYRLIIAGRPKKNGSKYWEDVQSTIGRTLGQSVVLERIEFIPDDEVERYFKAADVLVLPYLDSSQSGILFCGYSYGLPVVATTVGSFKTDVMEGITGFTCQPGDAEDLAATLRRYFSSELYRNLGERRELIQEFAASRHSWKDVAEITGHVYDETAAQ